MGVDDFHVLGMVALMPLPKETKQCPNCDREHEFFYGWPACDPSLPHGFILGPEDLSSCRFCGRTSNHGIHDRSGKSVVKHCTNCNKEHWFVSGWPDCDQHQPHGFMTYTGMEGRCQFCGGPPNAYLHNKDLL